MDYEADSHPLQQGDPSGILGAFTGEGDEEAVVDDDGDEHEDSDEGGEAGGRDLEVGADRAVEGCALLDEESVCLCNHGAWYECCG